MSDHRLTFFRRFFDVAWKGAGPSADQLRVSDNYFILGFEEHGGLRCGSRFLTPCGRLMAMVQHL